VILDTNAISALIEDDEALHARIASENTLFLPVIAIGELRFGLLGSRLRESLSEKLAALVRNATVLNVTDATTPHYADLRQALKGAGTPIPANDLWIAALARQSADGLDLLPLTGIARATIGALRLNRPALRNLRRALQAVGAHPPE